MKFMKSNKRGEQKVVSLNLDKDIVDEIDKQRDGIPRSLYINKILKKVLK